MGGARPTVGVFSPFVGGHYFGTMLKGVSDTVQHAGGRLIAIQTSPSGHMHAPEREPLAMRHRVAWDHLDGAVAIVNAVGPDYLRAFQDSNRPVVMISNEYPDFACASVLPDNRGGVRRAVQHLIDHGHRRIGFAGYVTQQDIVERHEAYVETLLAAGIDPDPALLFTTTDHMEDGGRIAARQMIDAGLPSTAVFCATDFNALGIIAELHRHGVRLPDEQAIVGFDGMEMAAYSTPSLTTVQQDFSALGKVAAEILLDQIVNGDADRSRRYVATALRVRESCGCADVVPELNSAPTEAGPLAEDVPREVIQAAITAATQPAERVDPATGTRADAARDLLTAAVLAAVSDGEPPRAVDVKAALDLLYRLAPADETVTAITDAVLSTIAATPLDSRAQLRVHGLLRSMSHWLARAQVRHQVERNHKLQALMRAQYEVSMELLSNGGGDLHDLSFLSRTPTRAGILALWTGESDREGNALLAVAGTYDQAGMLPQVKNFVGAVDEFPPEAILALAHGTADIVHIAPSAVDSSDWGMLAVVAPVETSMSSGRESVNQWAALLTVALDGRQMLKSLNEQSRTLAEAWERERQLVADAKASEERYILSTQAANGGLWDWDLQTGIVFYADRWKTLAGYAEEEINDTPEAWLSLVHAEDRPSLLMALDLLIAGGSSTIEHEHRLCRPDGTYRWKLCRALAVVGADGVATRIVGSLTDINERKELEDRLRRAALYDGLTGLPNRTLFLERLGRAVERAHSRKQTPFAVLFLDLDGFKGVNDTKGHGAGDELLVQVAQRIEHTLRGSDTAARLGGDEFAVLVDDVVGNDDAGVVSERLRRALSEPYQLSSAVVTVTTSIGVAHSTSDLDNPEEILREADFDMYRAKIAARATPPGPLHTAVP